MKEKSITLLSGNEEDNHWSIFIRVNDDGMFNLLNGIRLQDEENKAHHNEQSRRYAKTHKRKKSRRKSFVLLAGNEDNFHWNINVSINENGNFDSKGWIHIYNNIEKREYVKSYY